MSTFKEPIALVGSACRFPGGASSPSKLWQLLEEPRDVLKQVPSDRFNFGSFYHKNGSRPGATDVPGVAYLMEEDPRDFDAPFFNISPAEAEGIDPQQRILLEVTYEALEAAGYGLNQIRGSSTAVYVGSSQSDYRDIQNRDPETLGRLHATGTALSIISNRVSYFFDLRGPSLTLDTACSSSMVGLHLAVQALRNGDTEMAIVAGTNLILDPTHYISGSKLGLFGKTGQCRMWDDAGKGYGRGEGVAVLVLKRLDAAISSNDGVECIVRETGSNQDGRTAGITMPSHESQLALIKEVYAKAGLDPAVDRPQFFEAHGTGTAAGDPIEARAIHEAFFPPGHPDNLGAQKLYVGSIKTVIGHTEALAGVAGVMKASLALRNSRIPPNLLLNRHKQSVAPFLDHLTIPTSSQPWPNVPDGHSARASVNSFGFGGTNVHAILEAPPAKDCQESIRILDEYDNDAFVGPLVVSSQTSKSLMSYIELLSSHLKSNPSLNLDDLAWTLAARRSKLNQRAVFAAPTRAALIEKLDRAVQVQKGRKDGEVGFRATFREGDDLPAAIGIFTGQGAQWAGMGSALLRTSHVFRQTIDRCEKALASLPDPPQWALAEELLKDESTSRISEAALSQPLCTALQIALVNVLRSAGVRFDAVVGHSSGEIAACYYMGYISERDAMGIAYYRGWSGLTRGDISQKKGSMMATAMSLNDAQEFCAQSQIKDRIQVAASNSPSSATLSGDADAIAEAQGVLTAKGTFARELRVDTAYHSNHMLPRGQPYLDALKALKITLGEPDDKCIWVSSVRPGSVIAPEELQGQYWVDNMLHPVLFSPALEKCLTRLHKPLGLAIEVGAHPALAGPAKDTITAAIGSAPNYTGLLQRRVNDVEALSNAIGSIWQRLPDSFVDLEGYWASFCQEPQPRSLLKDLPSYSWDHKPYWRESRISKAFRMRKERPHGLLGVRVPGDSNDEMRWRNLLRLDDQPWLKGHQFQGQVMLPFACQVAMIVDACASANADKSISAIDMYDLETSRGVMVEQHGSGVEMASTLRITSMETGDGDSVTIEAVYKCEVCYDQSIGNLEQVCSGRVRAVFGGVHRELPARPDVPQNLVPVRLNKLYDVFGSIGLDYSGPFKAFDSVSRVRGFASASASWAGQDLGEYSCPPVIMDVAFQMIMSAFSSPESGDVRDAYLPSRIARLSLQPQLALLSSEPTVTVDIDAHLTSNTSKFLEGDISVFDKNGKCLAQVDTMKLVPFSKPDVSNDRRPFTQEVWKQDISESYAAISNQDMEAAVSSFCEHLVHKYPHAEILEIGSHGPAACIRSAVGESFRSYTYTEPALPDNAAVAGDKIQTKALDLGEPVEKQGFRTHAYDLVVSTAPLVVDVAILQNLRLLLRAGGFLLLKIDASVTAMDLKDDLASAGFSDMEMLVQGESDVTVISSRARDDRIDLLEDPLPSLAEIIDNRSSLIILGGRKSYTSKIAASTRKLLSALYKEITVVPSIEKVADLQLNDTFDCISLADLDQPIFAGVRTPAAFDALQKLIMNANSLLWYTTGRMGDVPEANASVGMGRGVRGELPWLNSQFIDVSGSVRLTGASVVEALCRLILAQKLKTNEGNDLLWTLEPEIVIDGTRTLVPRVVKNELLNDRFNAERRPVHQNGNTSVAITAEEDGRPCITELLIPSTSVSPEHVKVDVKYSVSLDLGPRHTLVVSIGSCAQRSGLVAAVTPTAASSLMLPPSEILSLDVEPLSAPKFAQLLAASVLAHYLAENLPKSGRVLLYGADDLIVQTIQANPEWRDLKFSFVSPDARDQSSQVVLDPHSTKRVVLSKLPKDIVLALNMSKRDPVCNGLWTTITSALDCRCEDFEMNKTPAYDGAAILARSSQLARSIMDAAKYRLTIVPIQEITSHSSVSYPKVIDWSLSGPLTYRAAPLPSHRLFSQHHSYFLSGMTGNLGLSLAAWMVESGARYLILASRNPSISQQWLDDMEAMGAIVKVVAVDITDFAALSAAHAQLCEEMPPIAGVCNASLVLSDNLFSKMDFESFDKTLRPKIDGSRNLDKLFSSADLQFFVLFGSVGSVLGIQGQSNYHAANLYMTSLVENRRKRGLAASIMAIGAVTDVGVVARSDEKLLGLLFNAGAEFVSETVLHHMLGEAVLASPVSSGQEAHIIIGPRMMSSSLQAKDQPHWFADPRLGHCIVDDVASTGDNSGKTSLREQINQSSSEEAMLDIAMSAFAGAIENLLDLDPGSMKTDGSTSLLEMGVDSGLAMQISAWFSKELTVTVPVMKVLSTANPRQLCLEALKKLVPAVPAASAATEQLPVEEPGHTVEALSEGTSLVVDIHLDPSTPESEDSAVSSADESSLLLPTDTELSSRLPSTGIATPCDSKISELSLAQSQLLILSKMTGAETLANISLLFEIAGPVNASRLRAALSALVKQQETLRCSFTERADGALQSIVHDERDSSLCFRHITDADMNVVEEEYQSLASHAWRLEEGDTFMLTLLTGPNDKNYLILACHHIIMDGLSLVLFLDGLAQAYNGASIQPPQSTYSQFAHDQQLALGSGQFDDDLEFWRHELSPLPGALPPLPVASSSTRRSIYEGEVSIVTATHRISKADADKLRAAARGIGCTPLQFFTATLQFMLARMLNVEDVPVGIAHTGRSNDARFENTIGHFADMVPLRSQVDLFSGTTFSEFARGVSRKLASALSHTGVPFGTLVEELRAPRATTHTPVFQVAIDYLIGSAELSLGGSRLTWSRATMAKTLMDLGFTVQSPVDGSCTLELEARDDLYSATDTQLIVDMYVSLLDRLSDDVEAPMKDVDLFSPAAVTSGREVGHGPRAELEWSNTFVHRVEKLAEDDPDSTAVVDESGAETYAELSSRVHSIASALSNAGVKAGSRVAVICGPTRNTLASMLAVFRLGCVYVPLDLSLPEVRHAAMIGDCKPAAVVCRTSTLDRASKLPSQGMTLVNVDEIASSPDENTMPNTGNPDDPAIILYTSGSTSVPKGVLLSQAGYMNYLEDKARFLGLKREVVLQQSSLSFDMGLAQMLHSISTGGTLVMVPQSSRGDPLAVTEMMREHGVTFTIATPSEYNTWLSAGIEHIEQYSSWRHVCLGGEFVTERLKGSFRQLRNQNPLLNNSYGPTETSCATTLCIVSTDDSENIGPAGYVGKPISNSHLFILGYDGKVIPPGHPGEICIAGRGLSLGYLDPTLNDKRFTVLNQNTKIYKTGDRGKLLQDGSLILLGRMEGDSQVKLRGLRIDTAEVENALVSAIPGFLSDAVVTMRGQGEDAFLVAHVVLAQGKAATETELQLLARLLSVPNYMVPKMILPVKKLTTTSTGKVDRRAMAQLPLPQHSGNSETTAADRLAMAEMGRIWKKVLDNNGNVQLSAGSDFFLVGGNSMHLIKLQAAIKSMMGIRVSVATLYSASTLGAMTEKLSTMKQASKIPAGSIDWDAETQLPDDILRSLEQPVSSLIQNSPRQGKEIVLTGATDFLGQEILLSLIRDPSVKGIHCIAIAEEMQRKIPAHPKVSVYTGTLQDPSLGLSNSDVIHLQSCADALVIAGSDGHCLNNYGTVRAANFLSTHVLARLALLRRLPIHYISSNRTILYSGKSSLPPVSLSDFCPPTDGSEGFTAAKWASEVFLEKIAHAAASTTQPWPITIHRPCAVIGEGAPDEHVMSGLILTSIRIGAVPVTKAEGYVDFMDVADVARDIAAEVAGDLKQQQLVRFIHHSSGNKVPADSFGKHLETVHGGRFEDLQMPEWLDKAQKAGLHPMASVYLEAMMEETTTRVYPYMGEVE